MKAYKNLDTGEIWTEDEIFGEVKLIYEGEPSLTDEYPTFEEYLDHLLDLGRQGIGGLIEVSPTAPKNGLWYAVQKTREDAWDYGSHDLEEAKSMLKEQGYGLIAVIDEDTNFCEDEILYEDI